MVYKAKTIAMLGLVIMEILALNYWTNWSWNLRTFLFIFSGICISIIPLLKIYPTRSLINYSSNKLLFYIILTILFGIGGVYCAKLFHTDPIDISQADMLPVIETMAERYIAGLPAYDIIPEIWEGIQPIYLPGMWMPYILPKLLQMDIRWIGYVFIFASLVIGFLPNKGKFHWLSWISLIPVIIVGYTLFSQDGRLLSQSEEPIVVSYYILLGAALIKKNPLWIGIAFSLCLLSRYSLAIWFVMYVIFYYLYVSKMGAFRIGLYTLLFTIFLILISGAFTALGEILQLPKIYEQAILNPDLAWKYEPLQQHSLGLSKYFNFNQMHSWVVLFKLQAAFVPFLCLGLYFKFKEHVRVDFFGLVSLKFTLVFFYSFLYMPYKYLFFTSVFLSIAIFVLMVHSDIIQKTAVEKL